MPTNKSPQKVAVIHDWLLGYRGGEKVLEAILEVYPSADVFTLFYKKGSVSQAVEMHKITPSFLNSLPYVCRYYRHLLPLLPLAIERFDLTEYDLVISSSHCVANGIIPSPGALHVSYCYTPMRYAWDRYRDYFSESKLEKLIYPFTHYLRMWDTLASHRVEHFIADSTWAQDRIRAFYHRKASVILPFVETQFRPTADDLGDYYLVVSAFAPYKKIDLAIEACKYLNRRLIIVGDGQDRKKLMALAGAQTEFLGRVASHEMADLYAGAQALLFPGEEDFGIVPLESMASGRPVIAYNRGGALDTVVHQKTGILFSDQSVQGLSEAILEFEKTKNTFHPQDIAAHARTFSKERFLKEFKAEMDLLWEKHVNRNAVPKQSFPKSDLIPTQSVLE